jgi:hypothetical protein
MNNSGTEYIAEEVIQPVQNTQDPSVIIPEAITRVVLVIPIRDAI